MTILNPEHLLDQAGALLKQTRGGPKRQVDLRRAISSAYYGVFHTVAIAAADRVVGRGKRATPHYTLVYRSIDHRTLNSFCTAVARSPLPAKYQNCCPPGGFGADMRSFSLTVCDLQRQRHFADYDPGQSIKTSGAKIWIDLARTALRQWAAAAEEEREAFLLLLLFPPR